MLLHTVRLHDNPQLYGVIAKALVAQCAKITYTQGCKKNWQCTDAEWEAGMYMQGTFFFSRIVFFFWSWGFCSIIIIITFLGEGGYKPVLRFLTRSLELFAKSVLGQ